MGSHGQYEFWFFWFLNLGFRAVHGLGGGGGGGGGHTHHQALLQHTRQKRTDVLLAQQQLPRQELVSVGGRTAAVYPVNEFRQEIRGEDERLKKNTRVKSRGEIRCTQRKGSKRRSTPWQKPLLYVHAVCGHSVTKPLLDVDAICDPSVQKSSLNESVAFSSGAHYEQHTSDVSLKDNGHLSYKLTDCGWE